MNGNPLDDFRSNSAALDPERADRMRRRVLESVYASEQPASVTNSDLGAWGPGEPEATRGLDDYPVEYFPRRRSPALALVVLLAVIVLVATGGLFAARRAAEPSGNAPDSFPDLRRVATAAASSPDQPIPSGRFQYRRTTSAPSETGGTVTEEVWLAADGSGLVRRAASSTTLSGPGTTVGSVQEDRDIAATRHFDGWSYDELRSLPTDPSSLRPALEATSSIAMTKAELGRRAANLASWTATPPAVRAAALTVLSDLGYRYADETAVLGHTGQRWVLDDENGSHAVVIDPVSARPIATFDVPPGNDPRMDRAEQWLVYEAERFTDSPG